MYSLSILRLALIVFFSSLATANQAKIEISSPLDKAKIDIKKESQLIYNLTLGNGADHAHAYIDSKEIAILRKMKGSYTLAPMLPGAHVICIKMVNKNHTPIGVDRCIDVTVE